ncbi:hypothetical protein HN51_023166 [Arachis hypogaea]
MNGGGGDPPPPSNGGEFLLSLIQRPPQHHHQPPPLPQSHHQNQPPPPPQLQQQQSPAALDPAVALMGPTIPFVPQSPWQSNGHDHPIPQLHHHHHHQQQQNHLQLPWPHSLSYPQNLFGLTHNPFAPPPGVPQTQTLTPIPNSNIGIDDLRRLGFPVETAATTTNISNNSNIRVDAFVQQQKQQELKLKFGSLPNDAFAHEVPPNGAVDSLLYLKLNNGNLNFHVEPHKQGPKFSNSAGNFDVVEQDRRGVERGNHNNNININNNSFHGGGGNLRSETSRAPPPGFGNKQRGKGHWGSGGRRKGSEVDDDRAMPVDSGGLGGRIESVHPRKENFRMVSGERSGGRGNVGREMGILEQLDHPGPPAGSKLHSVSGADVEESLANLKIGDADDDDGDGDLDADALGEQLGDSLLVEDESEDKNNSRQRRAREKDARSLDSRGQRLLSQRQRMYKRQMIRRRDIDNLNVPFLAIYESLIPPEEEKVKQRQLLALLEKLVNKEWPKAQLFIYGSCANSFGVSKSDIDICLAIEEANMEKSDILMKLADILQSDNLQNVQALTRARVPIVKLMDPATGISCDICINNLLAVVNTKLLRDYAQIDARLRQLAFIIKHWAKSRGVNETYHGTLSSYAYVLMCIHFLQQRRPAILPCLQEMESTYSVNVDNVNCAYFDKVGRLADFGRPNKETIAQLVWGFFYYWAYCHDYANSVISVRTGSIISKREKDWTRRVGNDRHLICIEDPFEISHDLGRVVDKRSIKVLREEFERAADIMQYDPNPCVKLFEPYVPS